MASQKKRLHWGCGELRPDDWINVDTQPGAGVDIACDIIRDGLPLESDSMEVVYCSPALQSFPAHELVPALRELRRVLKPGGLLRLCVPDFDRALQAYRSAGQSWRWCWDWNTQDGNFLTQLTNYGYARSLFTRDFVEELLRTAGFCAVSGCPGECSPQRWLRAAADPPVVGGGPQHQPDGVLENAGARQRLRAGIPALRNRHLEPGAVRQEALADD